MGWADRRRGVSLALLLLVPTFVTGQEEDRAALADLYLKCTQQLEEGLDSEVYLTRRLSSAHLLYDTHKERAREILLAAYDTPKPKGYGGWPRHGAVLVMGRIGDPHFFPQVLAALEGEHSSSLSIASAVALPSLARGNEAKAIKALKHALNGRAGEPRDDLLRLHALQGLVKLGAKEEIAELREVARWAGGEYELGENQPKAIRLRLGAMGVLLDAGESMPLEPAREWAAHHKPEVRYWAADLLSRHGTADDLPLLERLTQARYEMIRVAAACGLVRLGGDRERVHAEAVLTEELKWAKRPLLQALATWGSASAIPALRERFEAQVAEGPRMMFGVDQRKLYHTTGTIKALIERLYPKLAEQALAERKR